MEKLCNLVGGRHGPYLCDRESLPKGFEIQGSRGLGEGLRCRVCFLEFKDFELWLNQYTGLNCPSLAVVQLERC